MEVLLTEEEIFNRLNERLRSDGVEVRRCAKEDSQYWRLGDYYIVDLSTGKVDQSRVNIVAHARFLRAIGPLDRMIPKKK